MSLYSSPSHGAAIHEKIYTQLMQIATFACVILTTKVEVLVVLFKIKHFVENLFFRNDTRVGYIDSELFANAIGFMRTCKT